ncbi:MAG: FAD-dependent oxidoreductase, partial [Tepidiformaceae bacterium]
MNIAVVGGGLAGLAAACDLAERGHRVSVFERRPWAGGKTYSHTDVDGGPSFDNGQHVFMGCTTEYQAFLRRIGTLQLTRRQRRLRVEVRDTQGRRAVIAADRLPAPLHLARSFAGYRHLSMRERMQVGRALSAATRISPREREQLGDISFATWLDDHG